MATWKTLEHKRTHQGRRESSESRAGVRDNTSKGGLCNPERGTRKSPVYFSNVDPVGVLRVTGIKSLSKGALNHTGFHDFP